jgi:RND family efflux transporter MFP subunit
VTDIASGEERRFSGIVQATDTASLSFQVSGNVATIHVGVGDPVRKNDVLAELDAMPFELDAKAAEAELARALADFNAKNIEFTRQQTLFEKGWISQAALDQISAAYESSRSGVDYARSRSGLARRNLSNTKLLAPFDGVIAGRFIEPFQDIQAGQKLFELNASQALEVQFSVPETDINLMALDMPVRVRFPTYQGSFKGQIIEAGTVATEANAFTIKAGLLDPPPLLKPGMTSEVTLMVQGDVISGYLVPLTAVMAGRAPGTGIVFKFDPETSCVHQAEITGEGARDNMFIAATGLEAGDILAVAGVSFLVDGQEVRRLEG